MRLVRLLRGARGHTLIELVTVMLVLVTVLTALTSLFISGTRKELDLNSRVRAQLEANSALDRLRRDVHCAGSATASSSTLALSGCPTGSVTWCAVANGPQWRLYRKAGGTCDSAGKLYSDYLTTSSVFTYTASSSASLAFVGVDLRVNAHTAQSRHAFRLTDTIVLRNSLRG